MTVSINEPTALQGVFWDIGAGCQWDSACSETTNASYQQFLEVTNLLLERVQLNSTHLFRADILFDSTAELPTTQEKEARCEGVRTTSDESEGQVAPSSLIEYPEPPTFKAFVHQRTVVRRLIPRKPQLDRPLEQSCFIYNSDSTSCDTDTAKRRTLVVYHPHCQNEEDMPWYHPKVKSLAYLYSPDGEQQAVVSVHYQPFPEAPPILPDRLDRTFKSLLGTIIRLLKHPSKEPSQIDAKFDAIATTPLTPTALKDTILPQHIVQDTYTRLKQTYATDLISKWIEKTEPSKHVFEDLSIAAFLIELWNRMYAENEFPGFVDIACGNGVLTYILIKEGFRGSGFDARRRKTWEILDIEEHLHEQICIPSPFLDILPEAATLKSEMNVHNGIFQPGTFIISNHADELTCWTPILAALSSPDTPLPFLAIPCCSHSLDGSRRRYTTKDIIIPQNNPSEPTTTTFDTETSEPQPSTGDLKALRAAKQKGPADEKSTYACLTRKTASLAQELGCDVELTLMRIPSTRNIGVVGNRRLNTKGLGMDRENLRAGVDVVAIGALVERECAATGGVEGSARAWADRARKLQGGQGRGKVNLNLNAHGHS